MTQQVFINDGKIVKVVDLKPTRYRCPKCGGTELRSEVSITVIVNQDIEGQEPCPELIDMDLGVGFEDDAFMECADMDTDCTYNGKAWEFVVQGKES